MYTLYPALGDEQIEKLIGLRDELPMVQSLSQRRRMGENGINHLSVYMNSRWFNWTATQRKLYREQFPEVQHKKALVAHFLELPPKTGFLDRMVYWHTTNSAGTMLSYALKNDQVIWLNDEPITVKKGEGIGFSLRNTHEIKESDDGQLWACFMVLGDPDNFKPN